ncbi:MAG: SDR family oxidoreductase [Pseudomonadota bacterium]
MSDKLFNLKDKNCLITGGSRGLGKQMALAFAERGANVIVASRKLEECEKAAEEIASKGVKAWPYSCHVGDWDGLEAMVEEIYAQWGKIDVLVNNAGMSPLYPSLAEVSEALFDKVIDVNLKGTFRLCGLVGSRMAASEGGCIINISSTASQTPSAHSQPYGAAKAGVNAITKAFAHEYGPKVRVNCIMAGPFLTDISKAWDMESYQPRLDDAALGRGGKPAEIVGAALYLASAASSFTTGSIIAVDGGYLRD